MEGQWMNTCHTGEWPVCEFCWIYELSFSFDLQFSQKFIPWAKPPVPRVRFILSECCAKFHDKRKSCLFKSLFAYKWNCIVEEGPKDIIYPSKINRGKDTKLWKLQQLLRWKSNFQVVAFVPGVGKIHGAESSSHLILKMLPWKISKSSCLLCLTFPNLFMRLQKMIFKFRPAVLKMPETGNSDLWLYRKHSAILNTSMCSGFKGHWTSQSSFSQKFLFHYGLTELFWRARWRILLLHMSVITTSENCPGDDTCRRKTLHRWMPVGTWRCLWTKGGGS